MKDPIVWTLESLVKHATRGCIAREVEGKWVPARPEGYSSPWHRIRAAWMVFTGRADAVTWPGQ